ncbi:MAG: TetR-like C-terminal domain-containing protein [Pseudomonadota bacterium]
MRLMQNPAPQRDSYHHGNLPQVLIREGAALLAERGIDRFSMREVARRAGVAVAAPAHHFGNARGLLTAIAAEGFGQLAQRQATAAAAMTDPRDKVIARCRAYIAICVEEPGQALVMFRPELVNDSDPLFQERAVQTFALFRDAVARAAIPDANASQVGQIAKTLWSMMHGLQALRMITDAEAEGLIRFAVGAMLAGPR